MSLKNEIILRPNFNFTVSEKRDDILHAFKKEKKLQKNIVVNLIGDHIYLKFPKNQQHAWSPQLHLEILEFDKQDTTIYGVFGPNPAVWTLFMFLHFVVAGLFIGFSIWTYTKIRFEASYAVQLFLCLLMVILWVILYFIGRIGKAKGKPEMYILHSFMRDTLRKYRV